MSMDRREAIKHTALVMGGFIFGPSALGVLKGCTAQPGLEWKPKYFSREEAMLVEELTDTILPSGDTPGAKELGVPAFIEEMVYTVYPEDDKEHFMKGLHSFDEISKEKYGSSYTALEDAQKFNFAMERHREAIEKNHDKIPFFLMMKELTMLGYFTTEVGATQVLRYEATPGRYDPCVPFEEIGRTWAT